MNAIVETIALDDDYRLVVYQDEDAECPRGNWSMVTGFVKIRGMGDRNLQDVPAVHDDPTGGIVEADSRFGALGWTAQDRNGNTCRPNANIGLTERTVVRWARIFHGLHLEHDAEHGGYWFCDPTEFEANFPDAGNGWVKRIRPKPGAPINTYERYLEDRMECQGKVIEQEQETYRRWAEGEVYGVVLERKVTRFQLKTTDTAATLEDGVDWESGNSEYEQAEGDSALWGCYLDQKYTAITVAKEYFDLEGRGITASE